MSEPYVGELRIFAGNFAPVGWATCDGQLLSIADYSTLFTLIGTTYGGDGQQTFGLPNLAARTPIHMGNNGLSTYVIGQSGGVTSVTLTTNQIPAHSHPFVADTKPATTSSPSNAYFADATPQLLYTVPHSNANPDAPIFRNMNPAMLTSQGGSQPHDNLQPYLALTYIISLFGVFPSQG